MNPLLDFDILCESSAMQRIHTKYQVLFSLNNKTEKLKVSSAAFLSFGALRVE